MRPAPQPALPVCNRPSLDVLPHESILIKLHGWHGAAQRIASHFEAVSRRNAAIMAERRGGVA